ncbi:MAG: 16S rRNA (cytosine(1402)-N(4))-methyltransferase RsmH [Puniceicoccales bacterium]|jgi:16S rRNA (cytosine1402-N4)-methyltransferase|nr:16S rRNA (cytosine(1402)-N(4))-methyltransferase RsmH [Puniceicoccales bacterium]
MSHGQRATERLTKKRHKLLQTKPSSLTFPESAERASGGACQSESVKNSARRIDKFPNEGFNSEAVVRNRREVQFDFTIGEKFSQLQPWLDCCRTECCDHNAILDFFKNCGSASPRWFPAVAETTHMPVMLSRVLEAFAGTKCRTFLDGTLGGGGHGLAILEAFPQSRLWAMDVDGEAIGRARPRFGAGRAQLVNDNFKNLDRLSQKSFDGILLDLGLSSDQLDSAERGFSFRRDGPMDMRMGKNCGTKTAEEFLERATREELVKAVRDYGEEVHWRRVVAAIMASRGSGILGRTGSFAALLRNVLPVDRRKKIDPLTRTFQGIRIAINGELDALGEALAKAFRALEPGGALAVISFHSLEDRAVKRSFRLWSGMAVDRNDCRCASCRTSFGRMATARPAVPSGEEILRNPRSRSAKLRVFLRNESTAGGS